MNKEEFKHSIKNLYDFATHIKDFPLSAYSVGTILYSLPKQTTADSKIETHVVIGHSVKNIYSNSLDAILTTTSDLHTVVDWTKGNIYISPFAFLSNLEEKCIVSTDLEELKDKLIFTLKNKIKEINETK